MTTLRALTLASLSLLLPACDDTGTAGGGTVQFTASGEALALGGYAFPPAGDGAAFVDGWEVKFDKLIAVFDKVTLSEDPDTSPTDASRTGKLVAEIDGPWAIDLHKGGPLTGAGGADEQAFPIALIENQNRAGGGAFDPTLRYAFGFDSVAATAAAKQLNLATDDADYAEMVTRGWNVLYVGTATWKGSACTSTNPAYDFSTLPTTVRFRLGFKTPTSYVNCQNPRNDPAEALGGEEHQRGVQVTKNTTVAAQVTFHTDHPFWQSFGHGSPAHFDQLAALAKKQADDTWLVTMDDAERANYTAWKDAAGSPLPWRSCLPTYTPPNTAASMGFQSGTLPYNPTGDPAVLMTGYGDYLRYDQSTQGHLNSDGLCYVRRNYPSPN